MTQIFDNVGIEKVRSYWNARPCNIRHSPKEDKWGWHLCVTAKTDQQGTEHV